MPSSETYKGHAITKEGDFMPPVTLRSPQEVRNYTRLQGMMFHQVRVTDSLDCIVVQMIGGKYTFPPTWVSAFNKDTSNEL